MIDATIRAEIEELTSLAPLHNGPALAVIDDVARLLPGVPQVAAFDTAFHATLPPHAYLYALPYEWYERWGVRRFGFHGLSHAYCAGRAAELLGRPLAELKLVTCHLGSGCSLAAVDGGRSIATTMGFTPLDGLVMATRPGAVDPGVLTYLLAENRMTLPELEEALYHQSGLKGVSGRSGDMREILAARARGDARAALAFDLYVERLREGIGAMAASLAGSMPWSSPAASASTRLRFVPRRARVRVDRTRPRRRGERRRGCGYGDYPAGIPRPRAGAPYP